MSTDLTSINMQSRLSAVQDALNQRKMAQAQFAVKPQKQEQARLNSVPTEDMMNKMVNDTLHNMKGGLNPDRGSILNIMA